MLNGFNVRLAGWLVNTCVHVAETQVHIYFNIHDDRNKVKLCVISDFHDLFDGNGVLVCLSFHLSAWTTSAMIEAWTAEEDSRRKKLEENAEHKK